MERRAWTRPELLRVLSLYCQMPFGQMHARNRAVLQLSREITRTPAAIALKLVNFSSLDPELRERGVGGMGNTSAADRDIWREFYGKWGALADNAVVMEPPPAAGRGPRRRSVPTVAPTGPTEITRRSVHRRGQYFFRAAVLAANNCKCCITGIASEPLLRASHIVPWSYDQRLRLDPRNGLCLNALHDAAFDRGLITLTDRFELRLSKRLRDEVPDTVYEEMFESRSGAPITMPERFKPGPKLIEFHRTNVFNA